MVFYHPISSWVFKWSTAKLDHFIQNKIIGTHFIYKWSRLVDHLKTRPEIGRLNTILKPDTNMSCFQLCLVFRCLLFEWFLYIVYESEVTWWGGMGRFPSHNRRIPAVYEVLRNNHKVKIVDIEGKLILALYLENLTRKPISVERSNKLVSCGKSHKMYTTLRQIYKFVLKAR
jgi:hypothetical protein